MRRTVRITSVLLSCLISLSLVLPAGLIPTGILAYATDYSDGDIIEFGTYPQSLVTDEDLINQLNGTSFESVSYGFYSGTGSRYDGQMADGGFASYRDVEIESGKYRCVTFSSYRPYVTGLATDTAGTYSYQDDNGYTAGNSYWFKFEPVRWKVINASQGLIISDLILDSAAYNDFARLAPYTDSRYSYYNSSLNSSLCSDYDASTVRAMLNEDFYDIAFNDNEKTLIADSENDNTGFLTLSGLSGYTKLDCDNTTDKVFLLSSAEVTDGTNGFSDDESRLAAPTDYAECMGVYSYEYTGSLGDQSPYSQYNGLSPWWLRNAGSYSNFACCVTNGGSVKEEFYITGSSSCGVRPAMKLASMSIYTVEFDAAGGTGAPCTCKKASTLPLTLPQAVPENSPYDFIGWALSASATQPDYLPGDQFDINADTVLHALWGDSSAPEVTMDSCTSEASGAQTLAFSFSDSFGISGYSFGESSDPSKNVFTQLSGSSVSVTVSAPGTYYFSACDISGNFSQPVSVTFYSTSFDGNGGAAQTDTVISNGTLSFTLPGASREGYIFEGWSSSASASSAEYAPGASYTAQSNSTLYAVWSEYKQNAVINIQGFTPLRKNEGYMTSITFVAVVSGDVPQDAYIQWYKDGNPAGTGDTFKVSKAKNAYNVRVALISGGSEISSSETETVEINNRFFGKLIGTIRSWFNRLPDFVQT